MSSPGANPELDGYFAGLGQWRDELLALRAVMLSCDVTEERKWQKPCYTHGGGNVTMLGAMKGSAVLGFIKGALLDDPAGILVAPGRYSRSMRMVHVTSVEQAEELAPTLREYVARAVENERAGAKIDFETTREVAVPDELTARFAAMPELEAAFDALTPGRRRGYLMHFASAKQPATRESRIDRCVPRILKGEGLNDRR